MTVISMAKLLFWLTQVPLFTLGAWERTSGLWSLHGGSPFSDLATEKVCFQAGKKVKFVTAQRLGKDRISRCWAPGHFCCSCVWVWWSLVAPVPANLSIMTSKATTLRNCTLSCQRRTFWKKKQLTWRWRTSSEPWRRAFWGNSTCRTFLRSTARSNLLSSWWSCTISTPRTARPSLSLMSYEVSLSRVCDQLLTCKERSTIVFCLVDGRE